MSQRQTQSTQPETPKPQVGFEVREIMSLLTALESRTAREETSHVH